MAQQLDKISDATALIGAMVTRSRAAQSVLGKSDFESRCAALQAAAYQIRTQCAAILEVNAKDIAAAKASGNILCINLKNGGDLGTNLIGFGLQGGAS